MPVGGLEVVSTIRTSNILSLTVPPVIYLTLVALGSTDYATRPATFAPVNAGAADTYFQNIVTDASKSSPISNRWYITLTDCSPGTNVYSYVITTPTGTGNVSRRFPQELKVGGWIAGVKEGLAWRIVKIFNNTTIGAPNTYVSPVQVPGVTTNTTGLPTYVGPPTTTLTGTISGCVTLLVEDVQLYNLVLSNSSNGGPINGAGTPYIYFELNNDGVPNIAPNLGGALVSLAITGGGDRYFTSMIENIYARFTNTGAYEDNIPVIQSPNTFTLGDTIAPLTVTMTGSTINSTLTITSFSNKPLPPGTRPIESTHIFNPLLPRGTYISEQTSANTYRLNNAVSTVTGLSSIGGTFSYVTFVNANLSSYVSTASAVGIVTNVNIPSFRILSTLSAYSSTIIRPFTYKAFGDFYKSIPVSSFTFTGLTGVQAGSQLAVNPAPANIPATSVNDKYIVTDRTVSSITWLYLGQDTLTGDDMGILNPFGGGGGAGSGTATGGAVTGGGNQIYNDAYFLLNTASPPPAPVGQSAIISAKSIILPWTYPPQTQVGYTPAPLPYLSSLNASLRINVATGLPPPADVSTITIPIVTGGNSSQFINQSVGANTAITAVILQSLGVTSPYSYYSTFGPPIFASTTQALVIGNGLFSTISTISSTPNQLVVSYNNYLPGLNSTVIKFSSTFLPPGAPANFSSVSGIVSSSTSISINFTAPTFTDSVNNTNTSFIVSTLLQLTATVPPNRRTIPAIAANDPSLVTSTITSPFPAVIPLPTYVDGIAVGGLPLAPDTTYTVLASAINDMNISTVGGVGSVSGVTTFTTLPLPAPRTPAYYSTTILLQSSVSRFCSSVLPIYNITNNSTISRLISTTNDWSSQAIFTPLTPLYGSANPTTTVPLYNIAVDVTTATTSSTPGASAVTQPNQVGWDGSGWSATNVSTLAQNSGINLFVSSVDTYFYAPKSYQGYYYSGLVNLTLTPGAFGAGSLVPSGNPYMVNMRQTGTANLTTKETTTGTFLQYGGAGLPAAISSSTFYYNGPMNQPTLISTYTTLSGTSPYKLATGVSVTGDGTMSLEISTIVSSIGGYFYTQPVLQYDCGAFARSIVYNDFFSTVGYGTGTFPAAGPIPNPVMYSIKQPLSIPSTFYVSTLLVSTIVNNPVGKIVSTIPYSVMIDPMTISTLQVIPITVPTIPSTSSINVPGMLTVLSSISSVSLCPPFDTGTPPVYNHTVPIGTTPNYEACLQLTNGAFTANGINSYAYANYTRTVNNTAVNYSAIPGAVQGTGPEFLSVYTLNGNYRFAKFVWKLPSLTAITGFTFVLHNFKNIVADYFPNGFQVYPSSANLRSYPIIINYRIDDGAKLGGAINPLPATTRSPNLGYSTPWINAAVVTGSVDGYSAGYTAQELFTDEITANGLGGGDDVTYDANKNLRISAFVPNQIPNTYVLANNSNPLYVYLLVGLPTGEDTSFTYASASYF